jgi:hypothetical protein
MDEWCIVRIAPCAPCGGWQGPRASCHPDNITVSNLPRRQYLCRPPMLLCTLVLVCRQRYWCLLRISRFQTVQYTGAWIERRRQLGARPSSGSGSHKVSLFHFFSYFHQQCDVADTNSDTMRGLYCNGWWWNNEGLVDVKLVVSSGLNSARR